jgi:hypothetical protein
VRVKTHLTTERTENTAIYRGTFSVDSLVKKATPPNTKEPFYFIFSAEPPEIF